MLISIFLIFVYTLHITTASITAKVCCLISESNRVFSFCVCVCVFVRSFVPGSCRVAVVTAALYKISFTVKALYCTYADRPDVVEKNNKVIS